MKRKINFLKNYFWAAIKEGSKSNSYFNYNNYLKKYPDVRDSGMNPLRHYLLFGMNEGRTKTYNKNIANYHLVENSEYFDFDYYCNENNLRFNTLSQGLFHYLETGYKKGYNPSEKFDGNKYYKVRPDVKKEDWNPLVHYLKYGKHELTSMNKNINIYEYQLIKKSQLFDYKYYITKNNLNIDNEINAMYHYIKIGYKKGYNPSAKFNGNNYLKKYLSTNDPKINPLLHYLKYGKKEGKNDKCDKNLKEYDLVKESGLFDYEYYINEYKLDLNSYKEGLIHYLEIGYKKGYNPNRNFIGNDYLNKYPKVKKANFNPLVHYLKYGIKEGRTGFKQITFNNFNENYDVMNILNNIENEVSIIILIENVKNLRKCISNIFQTSKRFKVFLIDKYGEDENILEEFNQMDNIEVIKKIYSHEEFINTLNRILKDSKNDVIFLKDNIKTFKKWILKLTIAAYSNDRIGIVSPISNYSNVSLVNVGNDEKSSEFINNISMKEFNECPVPNDSCFFIKKDVFHELKFDANDDEKDWLSNFFECALNKGWKSVLDDSTFVYYEFDETKNTQKDKYDFSTPYTLQNQPNSKFINSEAFQKTFQNFSIYSNEDLENNIKEKTKKKILFAMHNGGGVEFTVKDIVNSIKKDYDCFVLRSFKTNMILYKIFQNEFIPIKEFKLKYSWTPKMVYSDEFTQIYFHIFINYNIDILEIDHLLLHTLDLPAIAKKLNIPIILTLHDFYYICPTYFLLDENNKYCGGYCGNQPRNCSARVLWIDLPANIVEWKNKWQDYMKDLFEACDSIITATNFTKSMFLEHYNNLSEDDITIIEHGRDLIRYDNNYSVPTQHQPIKILIPGVIGPHKGQDFIKELKKIDTENKFELHYIGQVDDEMKEIGKYHGAYEREDFAKWVYKIKPSFIGIFSVCAETYSHTLTEAICSGVPVLASNLGALKTRIESQGGGWLIDINDVEKTYHQILEISKNKEEYKNITQNLKNIEISTSKEMGEKYKKVYDKLICENS